MSKDIQREKLQTIAMNSRHSRIVESLTEVNRIRTITQRTLKLRSSNPIERLIDP